jgi:hypothetical protein
MVITQPRKPRPGVCGPDGQEKKREKVARYKMMDILFCKK